MIIFLLLAALLAAACGTRVPHEEALAIATGSRDGSVPRSSSGETGSLAPGDEDEAADAGATSASGDAQSTAAGEPGATVGGGTAATPGAAGQEAASPVGPKAPIVIGMIGNFSGVIGASFAPARDAYKAWVAMINDRGGINGHQVKLYVADDGNDAARDVAIAKDFVENRKVIALVNFFHAAGGADPVAKYAESKNVPVVGGASFEEIWNAHPMLFPASTGFQNWYFGQAKTTADTKKKKVAVVYCTEGAVCEHNAKTYRGYAESMGLEIVYEGRVSLAQPDYTAECINAQGAGAEVFYPVIDGASANRLAVSCGRQGFSPQYVVSAPFDPPAKELGAAISALPVFPWFLESGSPALQEYGDAMRKYAANAKRNSFTGYGWTNAKLFERIAANVSDTPTSQDLLEALWSLREETLGGIARPITFERGKPAKGGNCLFYMEVQNGKWAAPKGLEPVGCR